MHEFTTLISGEKVVTQLIATILLLTIAVMDYEEIIRPQDS